MVEVNHSSREKTIVRLANVVRQKPGAGDPWDRSANIASGNPADSFIRLVFPQKLVPVLVAGLPRIFSEFAVDDSQSQSAEACSFRSHRPPIHLALGTHCDHPLCSDPSDPPRPRPCASGGADAAPHRGTDRRGHQQLRGGATGSTTEFPLAVWDHVRTGLFGAATPTLELSLTREQARRCLTI